MQDQHQSAGAREQVRDEDSANIQRDLEIFRGLGQDFRQDAQVVRGGAHGAEHDHNRRLRVLHQNKYLKQYSENA